MSTLRKQGLDNEHLHQNIEIVSERSEFFQTELQAIQEAKAAAGVAELGSKLADSANELMGIYQEHFAGKERKLCDPEMLSEAIEGLYDLARQMEDLELLANMPEFLRATITAAMVKAVIIGNEMIT